MIGGIALKSFTEIEKIKHGWQTDVNIITDEKTVLEDTVDSSNQMRIEQEAVLNERLINAGNNSVKPGLLKERILDSNMEKKSTFNRQL